MLRLLSLSDIIAIMRHYAPLCTLFIQGQQRRTVMPCLLQVTHAVLITDIVYQLMESFRDTDIELILLMLKSNPCTIILPKTVFELMVIWVWFAGLVDFCVFSFLEAQSVYQIVFCRSESVRSTLCIALSSIMWFFVSR